MAILLVMLQKHPLGQGEGCKFIMLAQPDGDLSCKEDKKIVFPVPSLDWLSVPGIHSMSCSWETRHPTLLVRKILQHPSLFGMEDEVGAPPAVSAARHTVCAADAADNDADAAPANSKSPPKPRASISHCLTETDTLPQAAEPLIHFFLLGD